MLTINENLVISWECVLILGNWSYKNMGDELILLGTIRLLQKQKKKILISAYDPQRLKHFFDQFPDMEDITYLHEFPKGIRSGLDYFLTARVREILTYRQVDAVIIWGGEILTEESKNAYRYWNLALLPLIDKLKKIPIYLMWGIQVPQKSLNIKLFERLLKQSRAIYARDEDSVHALHNFGYQKAEFFMDTSRFARDRKTVKKSDSRQWKIALINLNKNGSKFYPDLLSECKNLLAQGYQLLYIPVSKGDSPVYNDLQYHRRLEEDLGIKIEILDWESDFWSFLQRVKSADVVITSRLHLFLIASYLWVETKVFPYQKKILKMTKILKKLGIMN